MARLIYSAITSLDGYIADADGNFDWSAPDEQVHAAVNDLLRPVGTHLYGRRMYDVMVWWETLDATDEPAVITDFAQIWHSADKVVYSRRLQSAPSGRTRIERSFDAAAVSAMKSSQERDLMVGGAHLAGQALLAGLVDDVHVFVSPVLVGGGTRALPDGVRLGLSLVDERRFGNGVVHLHYTATS